MIVMWFDSVEGWRGKEFPYVSQVLHVERVTSSYAYVFLYTFLWVIRRELKSLGFPKLFNSPKKLSTVHTMVLFNITWNKDSVDLAVYEIIFGEIDVREEMEGTRKNCCWTCKKSHVRIAHVGYNIKIL